MFRWKQNIFEIASKTRAINLKGLYACDLVYQNWYKIPSISLWLLGLH